MHFCSICWYFLNSLWIFFVCFYLYIWLVKYLYIEIVFLYLQFILLFLIIYEVLKKKNIEKIIKYIKLFCYIFFFLNKNVNNSQQIEQENFCEFEK